MARSAQRVVEHALAASRMGGSRCTWHRLPDKGRAVAGAWAACRRFATRSCSTASWRCPACKTADSESRRSTSAWRTGRSWGCVAAASAASAAGALAPAGSGLHGEQRPCRRAGETGCRLTLAVAAGRRRPARPRPRCRRRSRPRCSPPGASPGASSRTVEHRARGLHAAHADDLTPGDSGWRGCGLRRGVCHGSPKGKRAGNAVVMRQWCTHAGTCAFSP